MRTPFQQHSARSLFSQSPTYFQDFACISRMSKYDLELPWPEGDSRDI